MHAKALLPFGLSLLKSTEAKLMQRKVNAICTVHVFFPSVLAPINLTTHSSPSISPSSMADLNAARKDGLFFCSRITSNWSKRRKAVGTTRYNCGEKHVQN